MCCCEVYPLSFAHCWGCPISYGVVNSVFVITGNQARDKFDALEEFEQEREQDRRKLTKKKDAVVGNIPQAGGKFFFSAVRYLDGEIG